MAFDSLDNLLQGLANQPEWTEYRRYELVCQVWRAIIPPNVVTHTYPLSIHRNSLWVATSSAAWAQQLSLQRYSFLKRLNTHLQSEPLTNIRFSSAQWFQSQGHHPDLPDKSAASLSSHPSFLESDPITPAMTSQTPEEAFQRWTNVIQHRFTSLPLCPQCHCPTPLGELKRWSKCSICITQDLS